MSVMEVRRAAVERAVAARGFRFVGVVPVPIGDSTRHEEVVIVERFRDDQLSSTELMERFRLTLREVDVARALANRLSAQEIATLLGISVHTARRHSERVLRKLGVGSRREVAGLLRAAR